ncbi:head maturation protease, ClpP-related [Staphylococcus ureilyticus]|uniref:head maturation protease, ClpP-related n=1 Tax=Staphylococcus ureilyticus TaxID=94138 RepID=UPI0021A76C7E|nr:head maturation protease, ClpP-related [Staphylococcus ureilyticus]MCT1914000.1 Clp protease ClpP [Staphylococcus ureilyticus]
MSNNEIDIYGFIDSMTVEGMTISPQTVKDQLKEMSDEKEIIVNINSQGGDVFSGVAIYNMLRRQNAHITVNIDGLAASIASVIAMAGDTVNMPNNAVLMIHNAWTNVTGDSNEFKKQADSLERINSVVFNSYIDKNPDIDHALLRQYMDEETWFTAKEAEELGLIDNITESTRVAAATTSVLLGGDNNMSKRYRNEGPGEPQEPKKQGEEITVEDVMDKLEEILAEIKKVSDKDGEGSEPKKPELNEPPQNSFARLFNMQTK